MRRGLLALALLVATAAAARQPDGTLGLIRTPNNGVPAIVTPGGCFDAVLTARASAIRLVADNGEARPALAVAWRERPGGLFLAHCIVDPDAPPGTYALEAEAAGAVDRNIRSVYVRKSFPEYYLIAHLTDTHVGSDRHPRPAADVFRDAVQAANKSAAAFALVTGDLTDGGEAEQFRTFLEILDTCTLPTFVCSGNHDRKAHNYENTFGPLTYLFRFGEDGYIAFDTKDFVVADSLGPQDADLEVLRRAVKGARWAIGFSHRYEPDMGIRCQLVLFVDNPLDHFIFGHYHRANAEAEVAVPWGRTPITVTPATVDGYMRVIDVSAKGVRPRPPERVAAIE